MAPRPTVYLGDSNKQNRAYDETTRCLLCEKEFKPDRIIFVYCPQCIAKLKDEEPPRPRYFFVEEMPADQIHS